MARQFRLAATAEPDNPGTLAAPAVGSAQAWPSYRRRRLADAARASTLDFLLPRT
ncbi:hypothetical protein ABZ746_06760 [Streptomyces sp. NPDC020096]